MLFTLDALEALKEKLKGQPLLNLNPSQLKY